MKLLYTSLLIITVILSAQSQIQLPVRPYEPVMFNDLNPKWYASSFDPIYVTDTTDGYNHFSSIFDGYLNKVNTIAHNGSIYIVNYEGTKNRFGIGSYITKRNLKTGQLEWRAHIGMAVDGRPEFARVLEINSDGNLSVLSQCFPRPYREFEAEDIYSDQYLLTRRVYNSTTGELIEHITPDFNNITAFKSVFSPIYSATSIYKEGSKFRHMFYDSEVIDSIRLPRYTSVLADVLDDSIDVKINKVYGKYSGVSETIFRIAEDRYAIIEVKRETNQLVIRYVNSELKELSEFIAPRFEVDYLRTTFIKDYDPITKQLLLYNLFPSEESLDETNFEIYIVNEQGTLIKRYKVPSAYAYSLEPLDWKIDKPTFIGTNVTIENSKLIFSLDVLKEGNNGNLSKLNSFGISDDLRLFTLVSIFKENATHIFQLSERSLYKTSSSYLDLDPGADVITHIALDIQDLFVASTDVQMISYQVLPNPTTGISEVTLPISLSGYIQVHDMQGREVFKYKMQSESNKKIDFSTLPQGIYILSITSDDGQLYFAPQKVIKVGN